MTDNKKVKPDLTAERLRELLSYDADAGIFTWRVNRGTNKTMGKTAGTFHKDGSVIISIDKRSYYTGTLAWLYVYGVIPSQNQISYVNGNRADVRLCNLEKYVKSGDRELTLNRVREQFDYNHSTGQFTWKVSIANSVKINDVAGSVDKHGYSRVRIGSKTVLCHRLAWFYIHGVWPVGEIDHINGIRHDNRIENLRVVDRTGNVQNRHKIWGKSGFMGVYENGSKWRSAIQVNGETISLGNFCSAEEASAAYLAAKRIYHPTSTLAQCNKGSA